MRFGRSTALAAIFTDSGNYGQNLSQVYATGFVTGNTMVGGLVGSGRDVGPAAAQGAAGRNRQAGRVVGGWAKKGPSRAMRERPGVRYWR